MSLFKKSALQKREIFVARVEKLALACQMEFYGSAEKYLAKKLNPDISGKVSAALANHVFQFGKVSPQHASDEALINIVKAQKLEVLRHFQLHSSLIVQVY